MNNTYDSTAETVQHIEKVREYLRLCSVELDRRGVVHDRSKLLPPEKEAFDKMTPTLKGSTYGSPEYMESLKKELDAALDHHYAHNSHHPQFYRDGISGMCLFDLIEMLCDWKAATERHANGDIKKSLEINAGRFAIGEQLNKILENTAIKMGWIK